MTSYFTFATGIGVTHVCQPMDDLQLIVLSIEVGPISIVESLCGLVPVCFGVHGRVEVVYFLPR